MKKILVVLLLATLSIHAFSQKGDLTVGAKSGYILSTGDVKFNNILYGFDVAYHISDRMPLEVVFTGLMNPSFYRKDEDNKKENLAVYSASLDFRLYLINQREWSTGPALGGQYYIYNNKTADLGSDKTLGFNLGWHVRVNLTDYVKINGGWRYTNAKAKDANHWNKDAKLDLNHHLIYLGIGYTFELR